MPGRASFKFSIVSFQKIRICTIFHRGVHVIAQKAFIQVHRDLPGPRPFIDRQIFGMLALAASIDQPDIDALAVCIHPESAGIQKFLLLSAASAAKVYSRLRLLRQIHAFALSRSLIPDDPLNAFL